MLRFFVTALACYIAWIALTFSLGTQSLIIGVFVSLCVAFVSSRFLFHRRPSKALNPVRWAYFIAYLFVLLFSEIKAHFDVAYRVITGRIEPAIVMVRIPVRTDIGKTMLSSSITLTPGTLVVSAEDELYMHSIHYEKGHETSDLFAKIARRTTE